MQPCKIAGISSFQGDVSLLKLDALPEGAQPVTKPLDSAAADAYGYHPEKGLVLAQGSSRKHYHAFQDTESVKMFQSADGKQLFLTIDKTAVLTHEEHNPIEYAPGVYELFFQQEYGFEDEYRRVAD